MAKPLRHGNKWRIRWIDELHVRQSAVFNSFQEAKLYLSRLQTETQEIKLGLKVPIIKNKKCGELFDYYLLNYSPQKRNPQDDASMIRVHLKPFFENVYLREVNPYVEKFKATKMGLSPKTINNILTLLITMMNVAADINWIERVPKIKKPKVILLNKNFRYLKQGSEIERFLGAAKNDPYFLAFYIYAFAIYAGCRAGECAGLTWDKVDIENNRIIIDKSYDGPTKNGEARIIPILSPLLPVLLEIKSMRMSQFVFPNQFGKMLGPSARVFQEVLKRTLDRAELFGVDGRKYITFHCLRHTFASHWMMSGGQQYLLQDILGHKSSQMTQHYSHLDPKIYDKTLNLISDYTGNLKPLSGQITHQ